MVHRILPAIKFKNNNYFYYLVALKKYVDLIVPPLGTWETGVGPSKLTSTALAALAALASK